jgi:hypothetical protein
LCGNVPKLIDEEQFKECKECKKPVRKENKDVKKRNETGEEERKSDSKHEGGKFEGKNNGNHPERNGTRDANEKEEKVEGKNESLWFALFKEVKKMAVGCAIVQQ